MKQVEAQGAERGAQVGAWLHPQQARHGVAVRCADGRVRRRLLPLVGWLFDPLSYSQTVENIFYFSYLVKTGNAGVFMGAPAEARGAREEAPLPYVNVLTQEQWEARNERSKRNEPMSSISGSPRRVLTPSLA
jgi:hypothetical protein